MPRAAEITGNRFLRGQLNQELQPSSFMNPSLGFFYGGLSAPITLNPLSDGPRSVPRRV